MSNYLESQMTYVLNSLFFLGGLSIEEGSPCPNRGHSSPIFSTPWTQVLPFDVGDIQKRRGLLGPDSTTFPNAVRLHIKAVGNDFRNSILYLDYI